MRNDDVSGKVEPSVELEEVDGVVQEKFHFITAVIFQVPLRVERDVPASDAMSAKSLLNAADIRQIALRLQEEHYQHQNLVILEAHVGDRKPDAQEVEQVHCRWLDLKEMTQQERVLNADSIVEGQLA